MGVIVTDSPPFVKDPPHCHGNADAPAAPQHGVADVLRLYGADYHRRHPLTRMQAKVMRDIEVCRTAALGGHMEECDHCGLRRPFYNSCRNRHCPQCQKLATAEWLAARQAELLDVGYFHNVFTLPHELNPLAAANPRLIYTQLFRSVSATLLSFAANPEHGLGGLPGVTAVLHTWNQQLEYHVHLHCIIAGGALAADGKRWLTAPPRLFDIDELSRAYRAHFLAALRQAHGREELVLPGRLAEAGQFEEMLEAVAARHWVCFCREPFDSPAKVLEYLSRYTHRVAIGNGRLLDITGGEVTFSYLDRRDHNRRKEMTVAADEFIRRFLLHVLPKGLFRMRHYGILANRFKARRLARCRELMGQAAPVKVELPTNRKALLLALTGVDMTVCPSCGQGKMVVVEEFERRRRPSGWSAAPPPAPTALAGDTS